MKIQYLSDLHLEFPENREYFENNSVNAYGDILILAGDTMVLVEDWKEDKFFDILSKNFNQVFIIPGNHEFYSGVEITKYNELNYYEEVRENIHFVNNYSTEIDNVRFIFSTLWSKVENNKQAILNGMADFRQIKFEGEYLTIDAYNSLFDNCWKFVKSELEKESDKKTIVVTHHLPSEHCNIDRFKGTILNEGFCTDLTKDILEFQPDYWIFGHSHGNKPPFEIGNTTMLTNQFGYIRYGRSAGFDMNSVIEID